MKGDGDHITDKLLLIVFQCQANWGFPGGNSGKEPNRGFSGGASGREPACQCRRPKKSRFDPGQKDHLDEEIATHSSFLAWEIPWTEEPGGLQSMGS